MKLSDAQIQRTAEWMMYGSPTLRSIACVRCERTLRIKSERVEELLGEIANDNLSLDDLISLLTLIRGPA